MKRWFLIVIVASIGAAACSGSNPMLPVPATRTPETVANRTTRLVDGGRQTYTIRTTGSSFKFPPFAGFSGTGYYTRNNSPYGATLQITNSGTGNLLGVPASTIGNVALYWEAQLGGGASSVTFRAASRTMKLVSSQLQSGASYSVAVYQWNQLIEAYSAGTASNRTLTFQTPLSGITLYYYTPIAIELMQVTGPTPTPSPTPTPTPYPQTLYASYSDPTNGGVYSFDGDAFGSAPNNFVANPNAFAAGTDDSQNLYVTSMNPAVLNEYYHGGGSFTYTNDMSNPTGVAIDVGASAPINVANGPGISGAGQLLMFAQGVDQASPWTDPNLMSIVSIAVDAGGNVYVGGTNTQNVPEIDLVSNGTTSNLGLLLTGTPTGLALDQSGNLLVAENAGVAVFMPGQTTASSWIGSYGQTPYSLAFGNGGNWLYVLYNNPPCSLSCINVYAYPSGTTLGQYNLSGASPYYGVALAPRVPLFDPGAMRRKHPRFRYWTNLAKSRVRLIHPRLPYR